MPAPPVPYPLSLGIGGGVTPLYDDALTDWAVQGYTRSGDALIIDWWDNTTPKEFAAGGFVLFYWTDGAYPPGGMPFLRSTNLAKTLTGFTALQTVTVVADGWWNLGTGFDAGAFFGLEAGGVRETFPGGPVWAQNSGGTITLVTQADGSGNLPVKFLADGIHPSMNLVGGFTRLRVYAGVVDAFDIVIDSAVLYHNANTPISISRDGFRFDRRAIYQEYEYPGKTAPTYLADELLSEAPALIGKLMYVGERHFSIYDPGGIWASSAFNRTYTPAAMRAALTSGFYLSDVRCVWRRFPSGFLQVRFPKALVRSYDLGASDRNEGEIPVIIEARQDLTGGGATPKNTRLYYIDRLPSTWTV